MIITWGRKLTAIALPLVATGSLYTVWPSAGAGATPGGTDTTRVTQTVAATAQQAGTTRVTQAEAATAQQASTTRVTQTVATTAQQAGTTRVTQTFAFLLLDIPPGGIGGHCPLEASYVPSFPCVHASSVTTLNLIGSSAPDHVCADASAVTTIGLVASYVPSFTCLHALFGEKC